MARYTVTKEINSATKISRHFYVTDFFFIAGCVAFTWIMSNFVSQILIVPYWTFSVAMSVFLTLPSPFNKKRRMWQSIVLYVKRDVGVFYPIKNISKKPKGEK